MREGEDFFKIFCNMSPVKYDAHTFPVVRRNRFFSRSAMLLARNINSRIYETLNHGVEGDEGCVGPSGQLLRL